MMTTAWRNRIRLTGGLRVYFIALRVGVGLALDALQTIAMRRELEALMRCNRRGYDGVIAN
jgi:hypothetical protein